MGGFGLAVAATVGIIAGSVFLHELGHAWAARAVGWNVIGLRWRWYGVALVTDANGKLDQLWKVALGGPVITGVLVLGFLAGTALPQPASLLFAMGVQVNILLLLANLIPISWVDGGQVLAGIRHVRSR